MSAGNYAPLYEDRRTCRCCGRSIMYDERKAVDVFRPGLDICPDCLPHMFEKSCLGEQVLFSVST